MNRQTVSLIVAFAGAIRNQIFLACLAAACVLLFFTKDVSAGVGQEAGGSLVYAAIAIVGFGILSIVITSLKQLPGSMREFELDREGGRLSGMRKVKRQVRRKQDSIRDRS